MEGMVSAEIETGDEVLFFPILRLSSLLDPLRVKAFEHARVTDLLMSIREVDRNVTVRAKSDAIVISPWDSIERSHARGLLAFHDGDSFYLRAQIVVKRNVTIIK